MQLRGILVQDMTTNEMMNRWRYDYLKGRSSSPWSRGVVGNFREFFWPTIDWSRVFSLPDGVQIPKV